MMKVEIEVTDEMADRIILESLKFNLKCCETFGCSGDAEEVAFNDDCIAAFKVAIEYYSGTSDSPDGNMMRASQ